MEFMTMIFDIKSSRMLPNREEVQYKLIDALKEANSFFASFLACPFIITLGDEWQGLLKFPSDYNAIVDFFHQKLNNLDFYCGIGVGEVSVHNFELTVNQLDGPSFYKARHAIKLAKKLETSLVLIQ